MRSLARHIGLSSLFALMISASAANAQICPVARQTTPPTLTGITFDNGMVPYLKLDVADILADQNNFIKALRNQLGKVEGECFDAFARPLIDVAKANKGDEVAANAILLAILIRDVLPDMKADSNAANIRVLTAYGVGIGKPVSLPDLLKTGVFPWTTKAFNDEVDKLTGGKNKNPVLILPPPVDKKLITEEIYATLWFILKQYETANVNYVKTCRNAGVPIPPPINVSAVPASPPANYTGWRFSMPATGTLMAGEQVVSYLQPPLNVIGNGSPHKLSRMLYWMSAPADANQGFCVANPITNDRTNAQNALVADAFGIICQSAPTTAKTSTDACFWDNNGAEILAVEHDVNTADFIAPPHLLAANQCTECHAGSHAFNVMPAFGMSESSWQPSAIEEAMTDYANAVDMNSPYNTQRAALGKPKLVDFHAANVWYTPHVQPGWPLNAKPPVNASGPGANDKYPVVCTGCHSSGNEGKVFAYLAGPANAQVENHYKFCSFMLPNFLTKSPHAAPAQIDFYSPGTMSGQWSNQTAVQKLYDTCKKIFPLATVNGMPNKPTYPLGPPATKAENPAFAVPFPSFTDWVKPAQNQM